MFYGTVQLLSLPLHIEVNVAPSGGDISKMLRWSAVKKTMINTESIKLTISEQQAAKSGDGNKDGADAVEAHSEPARCGQKQEPGLCLGWLSVIDSGETSEWSVMNWKVDDKNLSAGPDVRQKFSGTSPQRRRLGSSTDPEEMKKGGRRRDCELQERRRQRRRVKVTKGLMVYK